MKREKFILFAFITILVVSGSLFAQQDKKISTKTSEIRLLNFDEVKSYLSLDAEQQTKIKPLIKEIKTIIEQNEKAMQDMRSKMQSMGMPDPSLREKMMKDRAEKQDKINGLVMQIEQDLNDDQLVKFKNIEKPNLMSKSKRR